MARADVLARVAALLPDHGPACVIVGIDGVDGAGKTTFADELAAAVSRATVRISVDDFHHVRAIRYRRGRDSAEGFWLDSFDYPRLIAYVFEPLRAIRRYRPAAHDLRTDELLDPPWQTAPAGALVIVDGLFLFRDELAGRFDFVAFLDVPFEVAAERLAARDRLCRTDRCVGASLRYFAACDPKRRADVLIDNSNLTFPRVV